MAIKAETGFSLKDALFNRDTVKQLSSAVAKAWPEFNRARFERRALKAFPELELKARIDALVAGLRQELPEDVSQAQAILLNALPEKLDPTLKDDDFGEFIWVVPGEYVAAYGCSRKDLDRSLEFLEQSTQRFSAESALRAFLNDFPEETMARVAAWTHHENYHVRRLASEGIRPYLPWARKAPLPPERIVAVLDELHGDNTRYVTRSVANTLNDISRNDPELVIATLGRWAKKKQQGAAELAWMTRHALRTLVKQDHSGALKLLGYAGKPKLSLQSLEYTDSVVVGASFEISARLDSQAKQRLKIHLKIYFRKKNDTLAPKVFALFDGEVSRGEQLALAKSQSFRPMTTRTLYPGRHEAELVINGKPYQRVQFDLLEH